MPSKHKAGGCDCCGICVCNIAIGSGTIVGQDWTTGGGYGDCIDEPCNIDGTYIFPDIIGVDACESSKAVDDCCVTCTAETSVYYGNEKEASFDSSEMYTELGVQLYESSGVKYLRITVVREWWASWAIYGAVESGGVSTVTFRGLAECENIDCPFTTGALSSFSLCELADPGGLEGVSATCCAVCQVRRTWTYDEPIDDCDDIVGQEFTLDHDASITYGGAGHCELPDDVPVTWDAARCFVMRHVTGLIPVFPFRTYGTHEMCEPCFPDTIKVTLNAP